MLSTKFASQQLKKHLLECSDSFLVSPTFPLAQCLMFRPSFSICRYRSQQHEKHCFDANLPQHRRSHDQKTKKGPQSEKNPVFAADSLPKSYAAFLGFTISDRFTFAHLGDYPSPSNCLFQFGPWNYSLDFVDADLRRRVHAFGSSP